MNYPFFALPILALSISHSVFSQEAENDALDTTDSPAAFAAEEKVYLENTSAWVSDEFFVPLRSTPCARCTIVHRGLKSGTKLRLLERVDGWGHLITNQGIEGWLEEQYLEDQPTARIRVKEQQKELAALKKRNSDLDKIVGELTQASKAVHGDLDKSQKNQNNLVTELAEIRDISSDAIAMSVQNKQLVKNNHMLQSENDSLKANVNDLQKDQRNKSFVYGGLAVFLGAILAILIPTLRRRKRFSEW
jgi:SH3 domain protein